MVLAHALRNLLKVARDTDLIEVEFDSTGVWRPVSSECIQSSNTIKHIVHVCVHIDEWCILYMYNMYCNSTTLGPLIIHVQYV